MKPMTPPRMPMKAAEPMYLLTAWVRALVRSTN